MKQNSKKKKIFRKETIKFPIKAKDTCTKDCASRDLLTRYLEHQQKICGVYLSLEEYVDKMVLICKSYEELLRKCCKEGIDSNFEKLRNYMDFLKKK